MVTGSMNEERLKDKTEEDVYGKQSMTLSAVLRLKEKWA